MAASIAPTLTDGDKGEIVRTGLRVVSDQEDYAPITMGRDGNVHSGSVLSNLADRLKGGRPTPQLDTFTNKQMCSWASCSSEIQAIYDKYPELGNYSGMEMLHFQESMLPKLFKHGNEAMDMSSASLLMRSIHEENNNRLAFKRDRGPQRRDDQERRAAAGEGARYGNNNRDQDRRREAEQEQTHRRQLQRLRDENAAMMGQLARAGGSPNRRKGEASSPGHHDQDLMSPSYGRQGRDRDAPGSGRKDRNRDHDRNRDRDGTGRGRDGKSHS
jgi:hypothetical protein